MPATSLGDAGQLSQHFLLHLPLAEADAAADAALIDAHIFRAMDEALFEFDFRQRPRPPWTTTIPIIFGRQLGTPRHGRTSRPNSIYLNAFRRFSRATPMRW